MEYVDCSFGGDVITDDPKIPAQENVAHFGAMYLLEEDLTRVPSRFIFCDKSQMRKLAYLQHKTTTNNNKWALKMFEQLSQERYFSGCEATSLTTEDVYHYIYYPRTQASRVM